MTKDDDPAVRCKFDNSLMEAIPELFSHCVLTIALCNQGYLESQFVKHKHYACLNATKHPTGKPIYWCEIAQDWWIPK
jgi:hypothetical protein